MESIHRTADLRQICSLRISGTSADIQICCRSASVRIYLRRSAAIFVSAAMNIYYFLCAIYKQLEKMTKRGSVT